MQGLRVEIYYYNGDSNNIDIVFKEFVYINFYCTSGRKSSENQKRYWWPIGAADYIFNSAVSYIIGSMQP